MGRRGQPMYVVIGAFLLALLLLGMVGPRAEDARVDGAPSPTTAPAASSPSPSPRETRRPHPVRQSAPHPTGQPRRVHAGLATMPTVAP